MTLSILTPTYNYGHFLQRALQSVESMGPQVEHVVVDGGSSDSSCSVLSRAARPGLIWVSEPDDGQSDALNKALALSRGRYLGWLNADEAYLPGVLEEVLRAFDEGADVVYGDVLFVDSDLRLLRYGRKHRFSRFVLRRRGCYISTCALFWRAELTRDFTFSKDLKTLMDWDLLLALDGEGANFVYLPKPLAYFTRHDEQVTAVALPRSSEEHNLVRARRGLHRYSLWWSFAADQWHRVLVVLDAGAVCRARVVGRWQGYRRKSRFCRP